MEWSGSVSTTQNLWQWKHKNKRSTGVNWTELFGGNKATEVCKTHWVPMGPNNRVKTRWTQDIFFNWLGLGPTLAHLTSLLSLNLYTHSTQRTKEPASEVHHIVNCLLVMRRMQLYSLWRSHHSRNDMCISPLRETLCIHAWDTLHWLFNSPDMPTGSVRISC